MSFLEKLFGGQKSKRLEPALKEADLASLENGGKFKEMLIDIENKWPGNCGNIFFALFKDFNSASSCYQSFLGQVKPHRSRPAIFFGKLLPKANDGGRNGIVIGVMCLDFSTSEMEDSYRWFRDHARQFKQVVDWTQRTDTSFREMEMFLPIVVLDYRYVGS